MASNGTEDDTTATTKAEKLTCDHVRGCHSLRMLYLHGRERMGTVSRRRWRRSERERERWRTRTQTPLSLHRKGRKNQTRSKERAGRGERNNSRKANKRCAYEKGGVWGKVWVGRGFYSTVKQRAPPPYATFTSTHPTREIGKTRCALEKSQRERQKEAARLPFCSLPLFSEREREISTSLQCFFFVVVQGGRSCHSGCSVCL